MVQYRFYERVDGRKYQDRKQEVTENGKVLPLLRYGLGLSVRGLLVGITARCVDITTRIKLVGVICRLPHNCSDKHARHPRGRG